MSDTQERVALEVGTPLLDPYGNHGFIAAEKESTRGTFLIGAGGIVPCRTEYDVVFNNRLDSLSDGIVAPFAERAARANLPKVEAGEILIRQAAARVAMQKARDEAKRDHETRLTERAVFLEIAKKKMPKDAAAVIVAELEEDDSDSMTDYFNTTTKRVVILGFSSHTRDLFPELRKFAATFPETAALATAPESAEHREKYSMGAGYYLKASGRYSSGWTVKKRKLYDGAESIPSGEWHEPSPAAVAAVAVAPSGVRVEEHTHTKRGFQMWIVVLPERVEPVEYDRLLDTAKAAGGWYSRPWGRTPGGFAFKSKEAAESFAGEQSTSDSDSWFCPACQFGWVGGRRCPKCDEGPTPVPATKGSAPEPDSLELNDWILSAHPEVHKATRYISDTQIQRNMWLQLWREKAPTPVAATNGSAIPAAVGSPAIADKLRGLADGMESDIANKLGDRLSNTPKRMRQAAEARIDGARLQRTQTALRALADLYERGGVPAVLSQVKSKAAAHDLLGTVIDRSHAGYYDAGIDTGKPAKTDATAAALWALLSPMSDEDRAKEELRRKIVALQFANIPGYFPTPAAVVARMVSYARLPSSGAVDVLEPSAGSGAILDCVKAHNPEARLSCFERHCSLQEILQGKGYELAGSDFMEAPESPAFDYVLMNPPFENGQDIEHVRKAFAMLKPEGRLVAIMGPGAFFRSDKKATAFREWFESLGGEREDLPDGAFKESGTSVSTVMVRIDAA